MYPVRPTILILPALLLWVAGCGSSTGPTRRAARLDLHTPDVMVVGDRATATVRTMTNEGCFFDSPCGFSTGVAVGSSRPDIIRLDRQRVGTDAGTGGGGWFELTALALGSATISAHVDGLSQSRQVEVVAETETR